jgi:hypothetical protein
VLICSSNFIHPSFQHSKYQLLYIYSIPPDDGLQICPKHVEVDWRNKLRINSASSWFLLQRFPILLQLVLVMLGWSRILGRTAQSNSLIYPLACFTRGPQPLPKPVLHRVRSSASSFNSQYLLFSLRSFSSCLSLLPRLPVTSFLYLSFNNVF